MSNIQRGYGLKTKKSLGQNFLINQGVLDKIVRVAELNANDTVLEIGPGTGNLTEKLAEKAGRIIAIEKDRRLIAPLKEKFTEYNNVEIIEADILKLEIRNLKLEIGGYRVVGNIPYYITSHLLKTIFEKWLQPKLIVLTVQKEVAQRIVAKPPRMNLLALSVQYYSKPEIIGHVSRGSFRPIPKVDSAIIKLKMKNEKLKVGEADLFKIMRVGFSGKRKQLAGNLARYLKTDKPKMAEIFRKLGIKEDVRAENLSLEDWIKISKHT
ncbi:MAG: ribosomal RNA small subunit methyltransferase A [Candidatus Yanofskybacteria bacterium RIFCSPHIGHO2_01_FULL_45_42]|uniref:Ribosomal RNA small subunit methyltransferase A n=2 Tax=Candidatus Yanofskyibacteriota TaxID=1752733 RepID=A0A1F8H328_9BACT|nr:MAG: ribosomal RNA small subunit methyltransferase A [Candidatus Yanofskybacteria bacterium RIFCSPHIGHO2_01_FULL_45_42]OGN31991.1 MAG: ribosomal RNA small subunit methyltransferase A [Candidatus Yanofskybacteria bacterium RIFCSPLOWO2_02_FULL_45_18]